MKKKLVILISVIVLVFNFVTSLSVSAYTGASSLYTKSFQTSSSFEFSVDGVLLLHTFYKTPVDIESLPSSERVLNLSYFSKGTWQGRPISELSSNKICDQSDTVGFSQTVSLSSTGDYFVYSVLTCLPCVAGDSFSLTLDHTATSSSSYSSTASVLPGVTGVKKVYTTSSSFYTDEAVSFTTKSDNQHLICLFTSDKFTSASGQYQPTYNFSSNNSDYLGSDYSNITKVVSRRWSSVYTSNYGLSSGTDLSLHLIEGTNAWSFSVYELFTDGTYIPGLDNGSSDDSGGSAGSTDLSGVEKLLKDILAVLQEGAKPAYSPEEFWAVYKSGLEEMFGIEEAPPPDPPPEESSGTETTEPTENDSPSFEIDEEQFESAMDYVNTDDLGESISGPHGAIAFFWAFADRFFTELDLYPIIALSLIFCLLTWLLRS